MIIIGVIGILIVALGHQFLTYGTPSGCDTATGNLLLVIGVPMAMCILIPAMKKINDKAEEHAREERWKREKEEQERKKKEEIEKLTPELNQAREEKNFERIEEIKNRLKELGATGVIDTPEEKAHREQREREERVKQEKLEREEREKQEKLDQAKREQWEKIKSGAESGDPAAQYEAGCACLDGCFWGTSPITRSATSYAISRNEAEGMYWLEQAAKQGHKEAYMKLYNIRKSEERAQEARQEARLAEDRAERAAMEALRRQEQDFRDAWRSAEEDRKTDEFLRRIRKGY